MGRFHWYVCSLDLASRHDRQDVIESMQHDLISFTRTCTHHSSDRKISTVGVRVGVVLFYLEILFCTSLVNSECWIRFFRL